MVTGAAQGIGQAIVRRLVDEGAFVCAFDLHTEVLEAQARELNADEERVRCMVVDVSRHAEVDGAIAQIECAHPIDGLVNAAGVLTPASFAATTPAMWMDTFNVNAHGTFFVSHCVGMRMVERRAGAIVNVASNAGSSPRVNMASYCASKAAVLMLTRCMGLELGQHGIRCNSVSPGSTRTPMLERLTGGSDAAHDNLIQGDLATFKTGIPLGRVALPQDIAEGVLFLLSDEARHITMHDLVIDGGATF